MPHTFRTAVDSCRHQAVRQWWGGGQESLALPPSPPEALLPQPQYGAYPDLPPHVAESGPFVSSNLLLQIISSLLVLLPFLLLHPSFCNNEMIWKKGGLVCSQQCLLGWNVVYLLSILVHIYIYQGELSFSCLRFLFMSVHHRWHSTLDKWKL